jgi:hypothetical protein
MRVLVFFLLLLTISPANAGTQSTGTFGDIDVYMLTILPGKEMYSMYGHSAIRVVMHDRNFDNVFNWGVFDFNTPNFAFKFAKGRLDYILAVYPYERLLQDYFLEQRTVISQKVNLLPHEKERLMSLAFENMKPENIAYRYDFFYDNCATRVRDIIEESVGGSLNLSATKKRDNPTFRNLIDNYQKPFRWLDIGIDLLLGIPADKHANPSEQMFLPDFLMSNMSDAVVMRETGEQELLDDPVIIHNFDAAPLISNRLTSPMFVLWSVVAIVLGLSLSNIKRRWMRRIDIPLFAVYSLLSLLLLFTVFFAEHSALKWNTNMLWLSPLVIISLFGLILNTNKVYIYRLNMMVTLLFLLTLPISPQATNRFLIPVILILFIRLFFLSAYGKEPAKKIK